MVNPISTCCITEQQLHLPSIGTTASFSLNQPFIDDLFANLKYISMGCTASKPTAGAVCVASNKPLGAGEYAVEKDVVLTTVI